jgi:DNA-binding transcriptional MerR regulator
MDYCFYAHDIKLFTGVNTKTLHHWDHIQFIQPSIRHSSGPGQGKWRQYSFKDLVLLAVANTLRKADIPFPLVQRVVRSLQNTPDIDLLSSTTRIMIRSGSVLIIQNEEELLRELQQGSHLLRYLFDIGHLIWNLHQQLETARAKQDDRVKFDIPMYFLNLFLERKLLLKRFYELGNLVGMKELSEQEYTRIKQDELLLLSNILKMIGISTRKELIAILSSAAKTARDLLGEFFSLVKAQGEEFLPKPVNILIVSIALTEPNKLPKTITWKNFSQPVNEVLQQMCRIRSRQLAELSSKNNN